VSFFKSESCGDNFSQEMFQIKFALLNKIFKNCKNITKANLSKFRIISGTKLDREKHLSDSAIFWNSNNC
jgi:hypothetical protein